MAANTATSFNVVGFSGLSRQLAASYITKKTCLIQGPPGSGKSEEAVRALGRLIPPGGTVWYYSGPMKSREFVGGLMMPVEQNKSCRLLLPDHWHLVKAGDAVCIDETDKVTHSEQNMWLEPACTRAIDGQLIGEGKVLFVFVANDSSHKSGSFGVSPLLGNRCKSLWFQGDPTEYLNYFSAIGVHHYIMAYLQENMADILPPYNPTSLRNATPRQWVGCSDELKALGKHISKSDLITTVAGFVPDNIALKVSVYYEFKDGLVPVDVILADPEKAPLPKGERGLNFMQLHMVASHCASMEAGPKRGKAKVALWKYAKRFPAEYRTAVIPCIVSDAVPSDMVTEKEFITYVAERKRILETGK